MSILHGCCIEILKTLKEKSIHSCVTSPPYFGLRDYGTQGQIGLETTPEEDNAEYGIFFEFEDDFEFIVNKITVNKLLNALFNYVDNWDGVVLSSSQIEKEPCMYSPFLYKIRASLSLPCNNFIYPRLE